MGPGDGVALHLPLRTEAFRAYREFSLPFLNTREFLGTPLLAAYRGGVLYPLTILLSPFDPFSAFQTLVVVSISLAGFLTYLYLKRLGAGAPGAFVGALSFAYGPYLLSHFEDTATLVATPMLPLVLLAAESHMNRSTPSRLIGLGLSVALLVLAGSPEALRAGGALLFGRLLLGHTLGRSPRTPSRIATALAILIGLALSAPQWLPTLDLFPAVGRQVTGLVAESASESVPGLTGLILMTVTHTPAASLAVASLPLLLERLPVRVLLLAVLSSLALQMGRGPLLAPGALPLVLEFALAALAGLALDEQWRERKTRRGRRLRAYFLVASLASVGVLSIAAATLGGLPERLAAAVGVYAIALITYFALADAEGDVAAGVFLLPLAVSFALQPSGREVFKDAPTRSQLVAGTPTRSAVDHALAELGEEPRVLTLVRSFPSELALDLGFSGYGALAPRVQANGYDPMAPVSVRRVLGEMGARGFLTERSLSPDVELLRAWSIDAIQVQTADLVRAPGDDAIDVALEPGEKRVFAVPFLRLKDIILTFDAVPRTPVEVFARVNGGREVLLSTVRPNSTTAIVPSPSYRADAIIIQASAEDSAPSRATRLMDLAVETQEGLTVQVSRLSAYLSQPAFLEIAPTPQIRVFRVMGTRPLISGKFQVELDAGPDPGGTMTFHTQVAQAIDVAVPFLPGWTADVPLSDVAGRIRAQAPSVTPVHLRYAPRTFFPGVFVALLGFLTIAVLLRKPEIVSALLKTHRDERK
ncbi:MAG: hypothetical protein JJE39_12850 [Vicinamibacteria bacterium]|nr:hypothetical protein [Vicinamibacteria bacterium]